jgi:hypothetical protein
MNAFRTSLGVDSQPPDALDGELVRSKQGRIGHWEMHEDPNIVENNTRRYYVEPLADLVDNREGFDGQLSDYQQARSGTQSRKELRSLQRAEYREATRRGGLSALDPGHATVHMSILDMVVLTVTEVVSEMPFSRLNQ